MVQKEYLSTTVPFPTILICGQTMHSKMKGFYNKVILNYSASIIFFFKVSKYYPQVNATIIRNLYGFGISKQKKLNWCKGYFHLVTISTVCCNRDTGPPLRNNFM